MAIQFIPLVVAIVGGAATVGAGVVAYQNYSAPEVAEPVPPVTLKQPEVTPAPKPEIKVVEEKPELPKFHLLRVEKDGSAVIAGSAPAKSDVEILLGESALAKAKATAGGDFAIVLDDPLKPGNHELFIRATTENGDVLISAEAGLVHVPDKEGELLAMVTKPGAPSKLIQKTKPKPVVKEEFKPIVELKIPEPVEEPVVAVPIKKPIIIAKSEPEPKIEPEVEQKPEIKAVVKPIVPKELKPVLVKAVEVENGEVFIAGSGEPGHTVNLYLDSLFLGGTPVGPQGAYLLEVKHSLKFGLHKVRADMLAKSSAQVVARAQVPLLHEAPVEEPVAVAKAAESKPKPKPVIIAKTTEPKPAPKPIVVAKAVEPKPVPQTRAIKATPEQVEAPQEPVVSSEPAKVVAKIEPPKPKPEDVESPARIIRTGSSVIIRRGDSLWRVSRRTLGQGIRYSTIYDANRTQIKNPHLIFPGQIFKIPKKQAGTVNSTSG